MAKTSCLTSAELDRAARAIRAGELVAFPTETVYGLGANALDAAAVDKIFAAKGRPATSPLIVHVDSIEMARGLVREWPERAQKLAEKFWPGPLTLVLPKMPQIPDRITAGLDTVGLRMPANPIALALIQASGVPLAAPSANRFTQVSPTTAEHVRQSLGERIGLILDGGPCAVGIESTVLSLAGPEAMLLRPGMIAREQIEAVIGPIRIGTVAAGEAHSSPGMHERHYSPRTRLVLMEGAEPPEGRGIYLRIFRPANAAEEIDMPQDPRGYAAALYAALHQADSQGFDWIGVEVPPRTEEWAAIHDRLKRAASR